MLWTLLIQKLLLMITVFVIIVILYADILPKWHTDERGDKALKEIIKKLRKRKRQRLDCLMGMRRN